MRMRHLLGAGTAMAMLIGGAGASAQTIAKDEGEICVTVAHIWSGTSADVARIAIQPVPDSFRMPFLGGGCARFQLVEGSLLEWHLSFGDEATATAALEFLAKGMMPDRDYTADLGKRVAAARAAAAPDYAAGVSEGSKSVLRLQDLVGRGRAGIGLAELYLRAAEFYGSQALLARAERYALPAIEVQRLRTPAAPDGRTSPGAAGALERLEVYEGQADALEMHLAIVRAALTRDPLQVAAAEAVVKAKEKPFYTTAAEEAYTHGDGFCDVGDRTDLADFAKACGDGNFETMAQAWIRMRAQLDILTLSMSDDAKAVGNLSVLNSVWNALRIIASDEAQDPDRPRAMTRYAGNEAEITLRMARADALVGLATRLPKDKNEDGQGNTLQLAMIELIKVEPLAPPSEVPGRFRQIATRFLDAYARAVTLQSERAGATNLNYPTLDRKAAYFRAMLPLLKPIAEAR